MGLFLFKLYYIWFSLWTARSTICSDRISL